jgi:predicted DNA-binding protein
MTNKEFEERLDNISWDYFGTKAQEYIRQLILDLIGKNEDETFIRENRIYFEARNDLRFEIRKIVKGEGE